MTKEERIDYLVEYLNIQRHNYYDLDKPTISDKEYDVLYDELVKLEKETGIIRTNSPTRLVGGEVQKGFETYKHRVKLLSLDKAQKEDEIDAWVHRAKGLTDKDFTYTLEYKFDGLTLNLTYEEGRFVRATTRGNGVVGEDVSNQVLTIKKIPLSIPFKGIVEVQGEGIMYLSKLEEYNRTASEPLKNARNAVAGAIRNLDPKVTRERDLDIMFYNINYIEGQEIKSQEEVRQFLKDNGFYVSEFFKVFKNIEDVKSELESIDKNRDSLDYLIDGAVIKINEFDVREDLGETIKFPRYALAYKFEAEEVSTLVEDVIWQVGRTGKLTPIAVLSPVELAGATVKRATCNNFGDITRKRIKIGSTVFVRRSNEVIPEILGLAEDKEGSRNVEMPKTCPSCGSDLIEIGANLFCTNALNCVPQIVGRIENYCSRDAMDIEGISEKTILALHEILHVNSIADLYDLKAEDLLKIDGFKDKKSNNIIEAIKKSKNPTLASFIFACGIDNIGRKSADVLAKRFKSIEGLINAKKEEIANLPDFGDIMADSVIEYFQNERNIEIINKVLDSGVKPYFEEEKLGPLSQYNIVFTGTLESFSRPQASKLAQALGAKILTAVTKECNLVVYGAEAGSKLEKAQMQGIECIDEDSFKKLINYNE